MKRLVKLTLERSKSSELLDDCLPRLNQKELVKMLRQGAINVSTAQKLLPLCESEAYSYRLEPGELRCHHKSIFGDLSVRSDHVRWVEIKA